MTAPLHILTHGFPVPDNHDVFDRIPLAVGTLPAVRTLILMLMTHMDITVKIRERGRYFDEHFVVFHDLSPSLFARSD
jgi:hypothetical protein